MRFGHGSKRAILKTTIALAAFVVTPLLVAGPPQGKGGGNDKDDGSTSDPPPATYMISWIEGFVGHGNESGDLIGDALVGGVWEQAVYSGGNIYLLNDFFAGTGATPRSFYDISERTSNAGFYLCGSCNTPNGIRGFRLLVDPDEAGILRRTEISYPTPPENHDQTLLNNVNSSGQAVGASRLSTTNERKAIYFSPDGTTTPFFDEGSTQALTETGVCVFLDRSGVNNPYPAYLWSPDGTLTPLLDNVEYVSDVNELLTTIGRQSVVEVSKKNSQTVSYNFILSDQHYQEERSDSYRSFAGLNDFDDVVVRDVIQGKGKDPDQIVGSVIFGDTGLEYTLDEMIDPANSDPALQLYLESSISVSDIKNSGVIYGAYKPLGANGYEGTIVLTPVVAP